MPSATTPFDPSSTSTSASRRPPRPADWRGLVLMWSGYGCGMTASSLVGFVLVTWAAFATGSAWLTSMIGAVENVAGAIAGPIGGLFADRGSRRAILVTTALVDAMLFAGMAAVVWLMMGDAMPLWGWAILAGCGAGNAITDVFCSPASETILVDLAGPDQLDRANGIDELLRHGISSAFAPMLGALALATWGPLPAFIGAVALSLLSAALLGRLRLPPRGPVDAVQAAEDIGASSLGRLLAGWRFLGRDRPLAWWVGLLSAEKALFTAYGIILIFFVKDDLGRGVMWLGGLTAVAATGGLIGTALAVIIPPPGRWRRHSIGLVRLLLGTGVAAISLADHPGVLMGLSAFGGIVFGYLSVIEATTTQLSFPAALRGRLIAAAESLDELGGLIGFGLAPLLLWWSPGPAMALLGALWVMLGIMLFTVPPLRAFLRRPLDDEEDKEEEDDDEDDTGSDGHAR